MKMLLGVLVVVLAAVSTEALLPRTESFKSHLHGLASEGSALQQCLTKVTHPLTVAANFATDVNHLMGLIHRLEGRVSAVIDIAQGVLLIPIINLVSAPVLGPVVTIMDHINNGLKYVIHDVDVVAHVILGWLKPIQAIQRGVTTVLAKMLLIVGVIHKAEVETTQIENCVESLPQAIRPGAESALEHVTGFLDPVPSTVKGAVRFVEGGCQKVEGFLHKIHLARRRKRSLPSFHKVVTVLEHIEASIGPVGHFLDSVHAAFNKKICLIGSIVKIGGEAIHKIEEVGKDIVHGAEHLGNEIAQGATHLGNEIAHGAEHAGQQIANTATHVGNEIVHEAEHIGQQIAHGATDLGNQIAHTAENVGQQIAHTAENVGQQIAHTAENVGNKVGGFFKHLFGRRSEVDGQYYIIVDADFDTRKRGVDLCFSVHDALHVVNGVTHGMMAEAAKYVSKLFHARSPFNVPALTPDVLHVGRQLHGFNIPIPASVEHFMHLGSQAVETVLHMEPISQYVQAVPACKAALAGVGLKGK